MEDKKHIISILVDNQPGVLSRITGLFSGRGYNIESLNVAVTMDPAVSRITVVTMGNAPVVEQIMKQLHKLINVIKVNDLTDSRYVKRELALVKVHARPETRAEILRITDIFRCKVVDVGLEHYTIEITATEDKMEAILALFKPMGIKEIVKTGNIAMLREPIPA